MSIRLITGDCREVLATLPDESVHCVVTSPPYWGLRDYGVNGQIGLEASVAEHIEILRDVFREVRRVLRKDGTCWVNYGDAYNAGTSAKRKAPTTGVNVGGWNDAEIDGGARVNAKGLKPKDLIGLPWRLAFALQEPYYAGRIKRETDRAWFAGLVDGEGTITILETTSPHGSGNSYPPVLQIRMCDPECLVKANQITGGEGGGYTKQHPPSLEGQRGAYQWRTSGGVAAGLVAEIYPFLLIKRKQAVVAWNHQAVRDGYTTKRGVKIPTDALEKQKLCRDLIRRLNAKEQVDLPSWMVEPPLPVEPGWFLRSDVIWSKPNPMPESVTDRPTRAHEYVFLLTKSARYWYDAEAVRERAADTSIARWAQDVEAQDGSSRANGGAKTNGAMKAVGGSRAIKMDDSQDRRKQGFNQRWDAKEIGAKGNARGFRGGSYVGGEPGPRTETGNIPNEDASRNLRSVWEIGTAPFKEAHFATFPPALAERCIKAGCPVGGTVLDPFGGAGTTGLVADRLQRDAILIELNPAYAEIAERRMTNDAPLFAEVTPHV